MISLWTFCWLFGGEINRSKHHQHSGSNWSSVYMLMGSIPSLIINFSRLEGFQNLQNSTKIWSVSLDGELGPSPSLHYDFLVAPSLSLHPLPSLITSRWVCLLELRKGHGGWMKAISYNERDGGHRKSLCPGAHGVLLGIRMGLCPRLCSSLDWNEGK